MSESQKYLSNLKNEFELSAPFIEKISPLLTKIFDEKLPQSVQKNLMEHVRESCLREMQNRESFAQIKTDLNELNQAMTDFFKKMFSLKKQCNEINSRLAGMEYAVVENKQYKTATRH